MDPKDQTIREAFLEHAQREVGALTTERFAKASLPQTLCWVELPTMGMALTAYELTGEVRYLRIYSQAAVHLRAAAKRGPDGYLGWYGRPSDPLRDPEKADVLVSEIQMDFRAAAVLSRFAEIVAGQPGLREEFGPEAKAEVALATDHLVAKWDGSFVDLGERGGVYRWNKDYLPGFAGMSLPQEKAAIVIEGLLGLYRVTGDPRYAEKAARQGMWFKRCLEFDGVRYLWNRWNPAGQWDVSPQNPSKWTGWIGREPNVECYAASVGSAVTLYEHGLVFDRADIARLLALQNTVCWNGDLENPHFARMDGTPAKEGERFVAPSLAPFDPQLARLLYDGPAQDFRVGKSASAWHGGVLAGDWLKGKYLRPLLGDAPQKRLGEAFLSQADPALVKCLSFQPEPPGFLTPPAPTREILVAMPAAP